MSISSKLIMWITGSLQGHSQQLDLLSYLDEARWR